MKLSSYNSPGGLHLPEGHHGCFGHFITVVGIDEDADRALTGAL